MVDHGSRVRPPVDVVAEVDDPLLAGDCRFVDNDIFFERGELVEIAVDVADRGKRRRARRRVLFGDAPLCRLARELWRGRKSFPSTAAGLRLRHRHGPPPPIDTQRAPQPYAVGSHATARSPIALIVGLAASVATLLANLGPLVASVVGGNAIVRYLPRLIVAIEVPRLTPAFLRQRADDENIPVGIIFLVTLAIVALCAFSLFSILNSPRTGLRDLGGGGENDPRPVRDC